MSAQPFAQPPFDASPGQTFEDGARTWKEIHAADRLTVKTRKRASASAASFNAIVRRAGIIEACATLNSREKLKVKDDPEYKPTRFDANEITRLYLTLIDAAQRTEWTAEQVDAPYPKIRRFKCSAAMMESFYKRTLIPLDTNEADKQRQFDARARAWRRRWAKVHAVQKHLHIAFFVYERGEAIDKKKEAGHFTDNLTDLLAHTVRRADELKGEPVGRFNRAADEALAHFRATVPAYAPEWNAEDMDAGKATTQASGETKKKEADKWKPIRSDLKKCVRAALQLVREDELSEDEAFARRQELHALIETVWADAPEPDSPPEGKTERAAVSPLSPVLPNADTTEKRPALSLVSDASESDLDRTNLSYLNSEKIANHTAKSQVSPDARAEKKPFSQICMTENLTATEQAMLTAEAFESVGVEMFKAVFVGIYPLKGDAEKLGSEPKQKGVSFTAADLRARIPEYIKRNREQNCNVAVRAWGALIQVDDCNAEILERLKPFAFYAEETSPGNFQVWLSLPKSYIGADGKISEAGKALRKRLLDKFKENGELANGGAYGSTRLPGTFNIKEKYQPDFPQIRVTHVALGRIVTPDELDRAGLLASVEIKTVLRETVSRSTSSKLPTSFPDYNEFLNRKLVAGGDRADRSSADIAFACRALSLGWSKENVISELDRLSEKAQGRKDGYSTKTVERASDWNAEHPQSSGLTFSREVIVV